MANNQQLLDFLSQHHLTFGGPNVPPYTPQYEISYLGSIALDEIWEDLAAKDPAKEIQWFMDTYGVTQTELVEGYNLFVDANRMITGEKKAGSIAESMKASGFADLRKEVQLMVLSMFGRYMLAAFWYAVRDKTVAGEKPPELIGYARLESLYDESRKALSGEETTRGEQVRKYRERFI